jgi:hypothetical protein
MQSKRPTKPEQALKLDYTKGVDDIWLTSQRTLRILIGILGLALPMLIYLVLLIDTGHTSPLFSISHYYFTRASSIFVIVVSLLAIFLLIYKGKEPVDFYLSSVAGLFALCLLLFPTDNITKVCCDPAHNYSVTTLKESGFRTSFHYISAAVFLGCLAYMSFFVFTRSDKAPQARGWKKRTRNKIYRVCGVIMVLAILVIAANFFGLINDNIFDEYHLTFWMEAAAVEAFGIAWLVKAEVILKDNDPGLREPEEKSKT